MTRIYLVIVNDRVNSEGFATLEQAQEFIQNRVNESDLDGQDGYYDVTTTRGGHYHYYIVDVDVML